MLPHPAIEPSSTPRGERDSVPAGGNVEGTNAGPAARPAIAAWLVFFVVTVALQVLAGAYGQELSGYPDEAAHFTTGLMIRDYLAHWPLAAPVAFAKDYYVHYPKVAVGHWPPLFHTLEAAWFLAWPPSTSAARLLMAIYSAMIATLIFQYVHRKASVAAAYLTGFAFVFLPVVRVQSTMILAENLLTAIALVAVFSYARYLDTGAWRFSALFGVFVALAIFVKGNAWELVLIPPIAVLLTGRFALLKNWRFWLPAAIVLVLCVPWQLATAHLAQNGWTGSAGPEYFVTALVFFASHLWDEVTPALMVFALAGIAGALARRGRRPAIDACMIALLFSVLLFHAVVPNGLEVRHVMTTVPVLISFVPAGIGMTAAFLRSRGSVLLSRPPVLACICGLFFVAQARPVTPVRSYGFKQAAEYLTTKPELRDIPVLTSSNSIGEGLMIVELELRESRPRHYVIRASKLLADDDWAGLHYNARYQSAAEVDQALKEVGADVLAIDFTAGPRRQAHHQQLLTMIADPRSDWRLAGSFGPPDRNVRPVRIYLRRHRAGSTNKETIGKAMANILDRVLN